MEIISGGKTAKIAGSKIGDAINVLMLHGKVEVIILSHIDRYGIEGFQIHMKSQPAAFYPWAGILKITKYIEEQI